MKGNVNYLELANSPLMWVSAAIAVGIVVFQSVLFFRKSLKAAKEIGIEQEKINMAIKSSAISSIGPSIVILVTMISLIVSMGAPGFGAQAMGATLENLTPVAFACGVWTMICGSLGWLIFTLLFTDKMDKVNHLMSKGNSKMVPIISAGAMLGAFANLASGNFFNEKNQFAFGGAPAIATIVGCILMMILTKLAKEKNIGWLREWAFAISMFSGMLIGYIWNTVF